MNDFNCGCMVLMLLFYFPISLLFLSVLLQTLALDYAFASEGQVVDATITSCEEQYSKGGDQYPVITYDYRVDDTHYEGRQAFDSSTSCDFFYPESLVRALYLPNNPGTSRIIGYEPSAGTRLMNGLFVGVILLVCCGTLVFVWSIIKYPLDKRRYRRLWRNGKILEGEIVAAKSALGGRHYTDYHVTVHYRFQTPDERTLTRKQRHARNDLRNADLPLPGTPVSVLYADDDAVVML